MQQVFHKGKFLHSNISTTQAACSEDRNDSIHSLGDDLEPNDELWQTVSIPKQSDIPNKSKA